MWLRLMAIMCAQRRVSHFGLRLQGRSLIDERFFSEILNKYYMSQLLEIHF